MVTVTSAASRRALRRGARRRRRAGGSVGVISADAVATRVDPTALPPGDGNVSTSPKVGNVDSCQTRFGNTGGAQAVGPWIKTAAKT
jgi:hypothetical protein